MLLTLVKLNWIGEGVGVGEGSLYRYAGTFLPVYWSQIYSWDPNLPCSVFTNFDEPSQLYRTFCHSNGQKVWNHFQFWGWTITSSGVEPFPVLGLNRFQSWDPNITSPGIQTLPVLGSKHYQSWDPNITSPGIQTLPVLGSKHYQSWDPNITSPGIQTLPVLGSKHYQSWARFTNKVKSIIMSLNFSSSQLARISLAEFVSKLILI